MNDDPVRKKVLAAASQLLRTSGPDALSNRRVAQAAGVSTMAIYSRFGSKGGILEALYSEGTETLVAAQAAVREDDPLQEIVGLCNALRRTAFDNAGHYRILFESIPDWQPSPQARRRMFGTFERLCAAVDRAAQAGQLEGEPRRIAHGLFAACHGHVMLSLNGYTIDGSEEAYTDTVERLLAG